MSSGGEGGGAFEEVGKRDVGGTEPVDGGDAIGIRGDAVSEVGSFGAQVVFGCGKNAFVFVAGVSHDEQAGAGGGNDANGAATAIERIVEGAFIEVAHEEDSTISILGQDSEAGEDVPHVLITGSTDITVEHGDERIDDDQDCVGALDALNEGDKLRRQGERNVVNLASFGARLFEDGQETNTRGVTARGEDAGFDGVRGIVFRGDEDNVALDTGGTIGHGLAGGDAGGEVEGDEGFAEIGIAVEESDFATEDALLPEPAELEFLDVGEGGTGFGCWRRRFSGLVGGRRSFFVKRHRICCPFK